MGPVSGGTEPVVGAADREERGTRVQGPDKVEHQGMIQFTLVTHQSSKLDIDLRCLWWG